MTALNVMLSPEQVVVCADTLATLPDTGLPFSFMSKVYVLPHLDLLMAGTGSGPVAKRWFDSLNGELLARDVVDIDQYAPDALRRCAPETLGQLYGGMTATIYHFGWAQQRRAFVGFVYRSVNGYASEPLPSNGSFNKPELDGAEAWMDCTVDGIVRDVVEQQLQDRRRERGERVGIGGSACIHIYNAPEQGQEAHPVLTILRRPLPLGESDYELMLDGMSDPEGLLSTSAMLAKADLLDQALIDSGCAPGTAEIKQLTPTPEPTTD